MRRYILLTLALLLVFAVQVVPQGDFFDGDVGVSAAIQSKTHWHTPSCTRMVRVAPPQRMQVAAQPESRNTVLAEGDFRATISANMVIVLRC